jgi:diguanylate cyclase (GGDEF)-like protein
MSEFSRPSLPELLGQLSALHSAVESGEVLQPILDLLSATFAPDFMAVIIGGQRTERGAALPEAAPLTADLLHGGLVLGAVELRRRAPFRSDDAALLKALAAHAAAAIHNAQLVEHATADRGTKLRNRQSFEARLERELASHRATDRHLALLVCEIDNFKDKVDVYGDAVGNRLRSETAQLLQNHAGGITGRLAGELFVALLSGAGDARGRAEELRRAVEQFAFNAPEEPIQATVSVGVAALQKEDSPESIVRRATDALHAAQRAGRNRVELAR